MDKDWQCRIIARFAGWAEVSKGGWGFPPEGGPAQPIPHYHSSLDSMHEAEKSLSAYYRQKYIIELRGDSHSVDSAWTIIHSTPAQRAEAFLKALGFWEKE